MPHLEGEWPSVPDIVDLILADHARILELFGELGDMTRTAGERDRDRLCQVWTVLAGLLGFHVDAADEISCPAVFSGTDLTEVTADDNDIRETLGEARLHPAGSRLWWLAVRAAQDAAISHIVVVESGLLPLFRREVPPDRRELLGVQWLAFTTARAADAAQDACEPMHEHARQGKAHRVQAPMQSGHGRPARHPTGLGR